MNATRALSKKSSEKTSALYVHSTQQSRPQQQADQSAGQRLIKKLAALVVANIKDENYGIHQLCRDAGLSRSSLHNHLKTITRLSASKFIRAIRLQRAQLLLLRTELNIAEVAYEVGFGDPKYFTRVFSMEFKRSPREFRRKQAGR